MGTWWKRIVRTKRERGVWAELVKPTDQGGIPLLSRREKKQLQKAIDFVNTQLYDWLDKKNRGWDVGLSCRIKVSSIMEAMGGGNPVILDDRIERHLADFFGKAEWKFCRPHSLPLSCYDSLSFFPE